MEKGSVIKYSLVHCYTDKNKGDAAIIIATTQLIRSIDKKAKINMFSTYGSNDKRLATDHNIIKEYADSLFPGCFYEPEIPFGLKNDKLRMFTFAFIFIKSLLMLISKNNLFLKLFLKSKELEAIRAFLNSDVIISKGGSFLVTENNSIRQTLSLIRMLYPFILAKRYHKKSVIFSQSLGPVEGKFNQWLFEKVLVNVNKIYLRESLCLDKYSVVKNVCLKTKCTIIPDTAFYLQSEDDNVPIEIDIDKFNVGYTLVDHDFKYINSKHEIEEKRENYKKSIIESMKYLIDKESAIIHIFPQVRVDISFLGHNDMKISQEIKDYFKNTHYEEKIYFYDENWTPIQLRNLYEKMDIFIGTRLHSVIFSLSVGTPAINIAYHGTKSQGILAGIRDLKNYVIDINIIDKEILLSCLQDLLKNREAIGKNLKTDMTLIKKQLQVAIQEICQK